MPVAPLKKAKFRRRLVYQIYVLTPPHKRPRERVGRFYVYSKHLHQYFYRNGNLLCYCPRQRRVTGENNIYIYRNSRFDTARCRHCDRFYRRRSARRKSERLIRAGVVIMKHVGAHAHECKTIEDVVQFIEQLGGLSSRGQGKKRWCDIGGYVRKDFEKASPTVRLAFLRGVMQMAAIVDLYNLEADQLFEMNDDRIEQYHADGKLIPKLREMIADGSLDPDLLADLV